MFVEISARAPSGARGSTKYHQRSKSNSGAALAVFCARQPDRKMDRHSKPAIDWITELANRPGHLIRRCYQILMAFYASETKNIGVTPLQYAVLRTIKHQSRQSKRKLGETAGLDRTTIGWIISGLEKKGLLEPTSESAQRRIKHYELTRDGEDIVAIMDPRLDAMQDRILEPLEPSERAAFVRSMQKIVAAYNEDSRAPIRSKSGR